MKRRPSSRRVVTTLAGFGLLLAGTPVIAAESSSATHSGDPCEVQLQQVRADLATRPAADPDMRSRVNEASVLCQQGEIDQAQKMLDQVARALDKKAPKTRTN